MVITLFIEILCMNISCQYNHLVIATQISLTEIKVEVGEPRRWNMIEYEHEHIMDTFIHITHWPYE